MTMYTRSQSDYFQLYAVTARAVKSVHNDIRVGGPATGAETLRHPQLATDRYSRPTRFFLVFSDVCLDSRVYFLLSDQQCSI